MQRIPFATRIYVVGSNGKSFLKNFLQSGATDSICDEILCSPEQRKVQNSGENDVQTYRKELILEINAVTAMAKEVFWN